MNLPEMTADNWANDCDVAFIVALREELQAADIFDAGTIQPVKNDLDLEIHSRHLSDANGKELRVLTVLLDDQGPENAAIVATKFLGRVKPKLVVLIGISGRISLDLRLGDVVLVTACDNSLYRAKKKGSQTLPGGKEWPLDVLASRLASAASAAPAYYSYSDLDEESRAVLLRSDLIRETPTMVYGPVSTTPYLVDDKDFTSWLQSARNRNLLAADMESAAVVQAAHANGIRNGRVLVVRGISDLADGAKAEIDSIGKGALRRIALRNAAQLASHCISRLIEFDADRLRVVTPGAELDDEATSAYSEAVSLLRSLASEIESKAKSEQEICSNLASSCRRSPVLLRQISDLADAAYRQEIDRLTTKHERILHRLPRVSIDYLTARWVMDSLSSEHPTRAAEILSKVYPQRITRFCKAILVSLTNERVLVDGLVQAYSAKVKGKSESKSHERAKAHICYLLGRLRDRQQRYRAKELLRQWRKKLVPVHVDKKIGVSEEPKLLEIFQLISSGESRMLLRTMCISLILLDQVGESEKYVRACLKSKEFDSLNRGFHLEYYGDIDYDPSQSMNNTDPVTVQSDRTFEVLVGKLRESYTRNRFYPLRDVDLQTLLSLAQHRHAAQVLEAEQRQLVVQLLSDFPAEKLTGIGLLQAYCGMLRELLGVPRMRRADFIRELCALKKLPRSGWNDSGPAHVRRTPQPESVLSHTAGGLILIYFCLPDRLSDEDREILGEEVSRAYCKDEIAKIFLSHDLAEAYTGDLLPSQRNDVTKAEEIRVNSRIDLFGTWPGFFRFGMYRAWADFENSVSINGRVAREIDALDNLLQLTIELEAEAEISDAESWKEEIASRVRTPMGKRILEMLLE